MTSTPSNDLNPYATGTADDVRDRLVRSIDDDTVENGVSVFRSRAIALVAAMSPVLVWLRDHKGIQLDAQRCYAAFELRELATLWDRKVALVRDPATGRVQEVQAEDLPADLHWSLGAYLADIPGYDPTRPFGEQRTQRPAEMHGYALLYFCRARVPLAPTTRAA